MFRPNKATAIAAHFLNLASNHELNGLSLMRLMVIAERECMAQSTSLITGAQFVSMQNGPALADVLDLITGKTQSPLWSQCVEIATNDGSDLASTRCGLKQRLDVAEYLSEFEIDLLTSVWREHGTRDMWDINKLAYTFPEWDESCEQTKLCSPIPLQAIFELGLCESPRVARERAEEIEYFEAASA